MIIYAHVPHWTPGSSLVDICHVTGSGEQNVKRNSTFLVGVGYSKLQVWWQVLNIGVQVGYIKVCFHVPIACVRAK